LNILVLGASGMLGHVILRLFAQSPGFSVVGSLRSARAIALLPEAVRDRLVADAGCDAGSDAGTEGLARLLDRVRPDVVVNCIGVVKQAVEAADPLAVIPINSLLPHRLLRLCKLAGARLIHFSTDCVFSGATGGYREIDSADATDLYGRSKLLGELSDPQALTLRMSVIGPELAGAHGLLGWFLAQRDHVPGFTRAVFSGLTTLELARVLRDVVLPRTELHGVLHVAAEPISKYHLLVLIARIYGVSIDIRPDDKLVIDRSLNPDQFHRLTGYVAPSWPEMVSAMHQFG
jgi:dTDP-4-dehydrorhamnose reductase